MWKIQRRDPKIRKRELWENWNWKKRGKKSENDRRESGNEGRRKEREVQDSWRKAKKEQLKGQREAHGENQRK